MNKSFGAYCAATLLLLVCTDKVRASSGITSLEITSGDHVYYVDSNNHVNQLYWTGQYWINQDLTVLAASASVAINGQALTSLYITGGDHVYYINTGQHINQMFWNQQNWVNDDMTHDSGTNALAAPGSALTSLLINNGDHVYYADTNQHINQMYWGGSSWVNQDLTYAAGTNNLPAEGTAMTSLLESGGDDVYYIDPNNAINHLFWSGVGWVQQTLTGSVAAHSSGLTGVVPNGVGHLYYVGTNQHVNEMFWDGSKEQTNDLTVLSGTAARPTAGSSLAAGLIGTNAHVDYVDGNRHINRLYFDGSHWYNEDVTSESGSSDLAGSNSYLSDLVVGSGEHIYYVDAVQHIAQIYWNGQGWSYQDLTAAGAGHLVNTMTAPSAEYIYFGGQLVAVEH